VVNVANRAFAIEQYGHGHGFHLVELADFLFRVEENRETDAELIDHCHRPTGIVIDIDAEQTESHASISAIELVEQWHFLSTGPTPGRPEIDHDNIATVFTQAKVFARCTSQYEIGGCLTGKSRRSQAGRCQDA
jgi:hypothetical protein